VLVKPVGHPASYATRWVVEIEIKGYSAQLELELGLSLAIFKYI
jgi:hypothetical protein